MARTLKVLVLGSTFDLPEVHIFKGLVETGVQVDAVVASNSTMKETLASFGVSCTTMDFRSRVDLAAIPKLRSIIRSGGYDILHCLTARSVSNGILASIGLPIKRLAYRGTSGRDHKFSPASWLTFLNPGVHKIICVSNAVKGFMSGMVRPEKLVTIYKGHDVSWYAPRSGVSLADFAVPSDAFTVACVANMRPVKGVRYLLQALRFLPTSVHLILIGEVRKGAGMEELSDPALASRVHLTGFRSDVSAIVAQANAFVLPSVSREGLPKAMLEAMAVGVPTVVTNVGGMPEVVHDMQNGLVVAPMDGEAIAKALLQLLQNPALAATLGREAKRTIAEVFTVKRSVQETLAVYRELIP